MLRCRKEIPDLARCSEVDDRKYAGVYCMLCGEKGASLYKGVEDRIFGTPGRWDMIQCGNKKCGLVWLHPMPTGVQLKSAYENYFTHEDGSPSKKMNLFSRVVGKGYNVILFILGIRKARKASQMMYLSNTKPGRLLEIGCGNGDRLVRFKKRGWQVEGLEFDEQAAKSVKKKHSVNVYTGTLDILVTNGLKYDAIILNHVLEHLENPVETLKQCRSLLSRGGQFVCTTPNVNCTTHKLFKQCWIGLDPPRHLYLYSPSTLMRLAIVAGYEDPRVFTSSIWSDFFVAASLTVKKDGKLSWHSARHWSVVLLSRIFQVVVYCLDTLGPKKYGEECILKAHKTIRKNVDAAV